MNPIGYAAYTKSSQLPSIPETRGFELLLGFMTYYRHSTERNPSPVPRLSGFRVPEAQLGGGLPWPSELQRISSLEEGPPLPCSQLLFA